MPTSSVSNKHFADRVLIVGASHPSTSFVRKLSLKSDVIVAVDGGLHPLLQLQIKPDLAVGDFDSLPSEDQDRLKGAEFPLLRYPVEKDKTDLELAFDWVDAKYVDSKSCCVTLTGVSGGAASHFLTNIGIFFLRKKKGMHLSIRESYVRMEFVGNGEILHVPRGLQVSLFTECGGYSNVTTSGMRWELKSELLQYGTGRFQSNESITDAWLRNEGDPILVVLEPRQ